MLFKAKDPRYRCLASYFPSRDVDLPQDMPAQEASRTFKVTPSTNEGEILDARQEQIKLCLAGFS